MLNHRPRPRILLILLTLALFAPACERAPQGESPAAAAEPPAHSEPPANTMAAAVPKIDIPNARMPYPDVLTGGQLTEEQLEQAAEAGYRTVVNLRSEMEADFWDEGPKASELGMRYLSIPISGAGDLNLENATRLAEVFGDPGARPLILHCKSGNRVGGLLAMKAFFVDGTSAEAALELGVEAGLTKLRGAVEELLGAESGDHEGS